MVKVKPLSLRYSGLYTIKTTINPKHSAFSFRVLTHSLLLHEAAEMDSVSPTRSFREQVALAIWKEANFLSPPPRKIHLTP